MTRPRLQSGCDAPGSYPICGMALEPRVIAQSKLAFYRYRDTNSVVGKAVGMRHGYGGHLVHEKSAQSGQSGW